MRLSNVADRLFRSLVIPALLLTLYIYLYPAVHGCHFPRPRSHPHSESQPTGSIAPFRLLVYADPQLEGDTSLPTSDAPPLSSLIFLLDRVHGATVLELPGFIAVAAAQSLVRRVGTPLQRVRKRLDLLGNDLYLAHIHRSVKWWTAPSHVAVLGDLLGSQWISDAEFQRRADRYWHTVFRGAQRLPDELMDHGQLHTLGSSSNDPWRKYLINIAGNHDIGYAGDIDSSRIRRFDNAFGRLNWNTRFALPGPLSNKTIDTAGEQDPTLRLVVLNTMNMDSPAWQEQLQRETNEYLAAQFDTTKTLGSRDATILLTHIPLYKAPGMCTDGPFFAYFSKEQGSGIKEQNHLSADSSLAILDGLFDAQVNAHGIILNGHDHEGCSLYHYKSTLGDETSIGHWSTVRHGLARHDSTHNGKSKGHGVQEVTVRSMMGQFGGNAGLLSAWFDAEADRWAFEYADCEFRVQHIWWTAHVLDLMVALFGAMALYLRRRPLAALSDASASSAK